MFDEIFLITFDSRSDNWMDMVTNYSKTGLFMLYSRKKNIGKDDNKVLYRK